MPTENEDSMIKTFEDAKEICDSYGGVNLQWQMMQLRAMAQARRRRAELCSRDVGR